MGGIREFNCACLIVSLVLTLLLIHPTVLHCRVLFPGLYSGDPDVSFDTQPIKKPEEGEHETPRYHGV